MQDNAMSKKVKEHFIYFQNQSNSYFFNNLHATTCNYTLAGQAFIWPSQSVCYIKLT